MEAGLNGHQLGAQCLVAVPWNASSGLATIPSRFVVVNSAQGMDRRENPAMPKLAQVTKNHTNRMLYTVVVLVSNFFK